MGALKSNLLDGCLYVLNRLLLLYPVPCTHSTPSPSPLPLPPPLSLQEIPPYNGFGALEDSLQSCLSLIPQPPKKDFIKMLENDGKTLRFAAVMVC